VTFLKRSFVRVDNTGSLWKAPLDKTSIEERCNWIRECEVPAMALYQNLESALFEASIHGVDYFSDLKFRIDNALERVVLAPTTWDFQVFNARWWANITGACMPQVSLNKLVEMSKKNHINLGFTFRNQLVGGELTLGDALTRAKKAPLMRYEA